MGNTPIFSRLVTELVCQFTRVPAGVFLCAEEEAGCTHAVQPEGEHSAYSHTGADGVRSPLQAAAAWQPAGHHRCPQRSCVCAQRGPQLRAPTPSEAAAP